MRISALFLILISIDARATIPKVEANGVPEIKVDICKDTHVISLEMIELELSGRRWVGGTSPCLKQSKFKTLYAFKSDDGDSYLSKPEYVLSDGREIRIVSEKLEPNDQVDVRIAYIGKKNGKDRRLIFVRVEFWKSPGRSGMWQHLFRHHPFCHERKLS